MNETGSYMFDRQRVCIHERETTCGIWIDGQSKSVSTLAGHLDRLLLCVSCGRKRHKVRSQIKQSVVHMDETLWPGLAVLDPRANVEKFRRGQTEEQSSVVRKRKVEKHNHATPSQSSSQTALHLAGQSSVISYSWKVPSHRRDTICA